MNDRRMALNVLDSFIRTGIPMSDGLRLLFQKQIGSLSEDEWDRIHEAMKVRAELDERDSQRYL